MPDGNEISRFSYVSTGVLWLTPCLYAQLLYILQHKNVLPIKGEGKGSQHKLYSNYLFNKIPYQICLITSGQGSMNEILPCTLPRNGVAKIVPQFSVCFKRGGGDTEYSIFLLC